MTAFDREIRRELHDAIVFEAWSRNNALTREQCEFIAEAALDAITQEGFEIHLGTLAGVRYANEMIARVLGAKRSKPTFADDAESEFGDT